MSKIQHKSNSFVSEVQYLNISIPQLSIIASENQWYMNIVNGQLKYVVVAVDSEQAAAVIINDIFNRVAKDWNSLEDLSALVSEKVFHNEGLWQGQVK